MLIFLKIAAAILLLILIGFTVRTLQLSWTTNQQSFKKGTVTQMPDGLYAGSVGETKVSWLGKKFNLSAMTGINLFANADGSTVEKYPFAFSVGKGSHDSISVIKIDYDYGNNPFWLRLILDEIVEVAPGEYLGKLQLRIIPGYPFTLSFFSLTKSS